MNKNLYRRHFKKINILKNRKLFYSILVVFVIILCLFIMFLVGHSFYVNSEPYNYSVQLIESNYKLKSFLGYDYKISWYIGGELSENKAFIKYKIYGKDTEARVEVEAEKIMDTWKYKRIQFIKYVQPEETIDLISK